MSKQIIHTDKAPAAVGTYSQAVRHGDLVFLSGQIPLDPATMELVEDEVIMGSAACEDGTVESQALTLGNHDLYLRAMADDAGEMLLIQRVDSGLWAAPGGAFDVGETAAEGAVRECHEETGWRVEPVGPTTFATC